MPKVTTELYCSICFNDGEGDWTSLIPCGHLFHEPCVRRWCNPPPQPRGEPKSKKPDWCPLCRAKILRPIAGKRNTSDNSRFRKLVFPNEVKVDLSSSPARFGQNDIVANTDRGEGPSNGVKSLGRRGVVIGSSSEDEADMRPLRFDTLQAEPLAGAEAILTESESDEDNARPARPVYPRGAAGAGDQARASTSANNQASGNNDTLGEARATIAAKNEQIAQLRSQLAESAEEAQSVLRGLNGAVEEQQIIENRLKEKCEELKRVQEEIKKAKEDKRGLSKSIKVEVEKVGELSKTNKKLIEEITLLKDKYSKLKHDHEQLEASYNTTTDDYQSRLEAAKQAESTYKDRFTRVFELNRVNQKKLDLKRERIKALEAELAKYKNGEEARRKAKGKGRAIDQDNINDETYEHEDSFTAPRSRQVSNKSIDETSYMAQMPDEDDFEESLLVTEVPDTEGHEVFHIADDDEDAFADLDIVLPGPKSTHKRVLAPSKSILSRDPLREWTNSESGKSTTTATAREKQSSSTASSGTNAKKRSLTTVTSASDKWANMALFGTSKNGKNSVVSHGEKKKSRTAF